jgi:hypothetical protein
MTNFEKPRKARTSGAERNGCEAVQYSDQMYCARCGVTYDVNDFDPPNCKEKESPAMSILKSLFPEK